MVNNNIIYNKNYKVRIRCHLNIYICSMKNVIFHVFHECVLSKFHTHATI